jgi:hypothetical protein
MSHFIPRSKTVCTSLRGPRASVIVRVERGTKRLVLRKGADNILLLAGGTRMAWLPDGWSVVSPDGEVIRAVGRFAVTLETIDPYHAVTDIF